MDIIGSARRWMEKFTEMEPKEPTTPPTAPPTAYSIRKKQGPGMFGADIGDDSDIAGRERTYKGNDGKDVTSNK